MAKEIDLIMNPAQAPAELKAAVDAHKISYNKLVKAQTAMRDAKTGLNTASDAFAKTESAYLNLLNLWEVK